LVINEERREETIQEISQEKLERRSEEKSIVVTCKEKSGKR
jgi:hypothetical protein